MQLTIKQKAFSWLDSYEIKDKKGDTAFTVKGRIGIGKCLDVYDANGNKVGSVNEKMVSMLPHYKIYIGEECVGEIAKNISMLKEKYTLDFNDWRVEGDLLDWDYEIFDGRRPIIKVNRRAVRIINPVYTLDIKDERNALLAVMVSVAVFAMGSENKDK